jgi:hypothetical protein
MAIQAKQSANFHTILNTRYKHKIEMMKWKKWNDDGKKNTRNPQRERVSGILRRKKAIFRPNKFTICLICL